MCGRYATTRSAADLSALFEAYDDTGDQLRPNYNVAPTTAVPIVRDAAAAEDAVTARGAGAAAVLSVARWGFLPPWARDVRAGARMINARAETVATSRAYASSFARRRCLVPADGWYEWTRRDGVRQAYYMTPRDGSVLALAGLWSIWRGADVPLLTYTVVTTAALGDLAGIHDRMPLLLPRDRWDDWLAGGGEPGDLLAPPTEEWLGGLEIRPVGKAVGDVRNNGPDLIAAVPAPPLRALPEEPAASTLF
jgi:putative SOS response-associated peptidase YedK